jgi:hypothetical protein
MQQLDSTEAYLDALSHELCFDPPLAQRVCSEVRGHFEDALATSSGSPREAGVIERFGDPRTVAAGFAPIIVRRLRAGVAVALGVALAAVFAAMEARVALMPRQGGGTLSHHASSFALIVDQTSFISAFVAATLLWVAIAVRPFEQASQVLFKTLSVAAVGFLTGSVVADAFVAFGEVGSLGATPSTLWAFVTIAFEILALVYLEKQFLRATRHLSQLACLSS